MHLHTTYWVLAFTTAAGLIAADSAQPANVMLEAAHKKEVVDGDLNAAIKQYSAIVAKYAKTDRAASAMALVHMAECHQKLGDAESQKIYEQVLREYADQKEAVTLARARLSHSVPQTQESGTVARLLWTSNLAFGGGAPSPDGRYLAFVNWDDGGNLAIHDLTAGDNRAVTHRTDGSSAESPVFTPDGKRLVYGWYDGTADKWSLRSIALDGSNERVMPIDGYPEAISPDGKTAAVRINQNGAQRIAIADLASGKVTALKSVEWRQPQIGNFSPDGRTIAYSLLTSQDSQDRDIYTLAVDGSSESRLVAAPGANGRPFFSPDGSRVVFTSDRSGHWDLWSVAVSQAKAQGSPELLKAEIGPVASIGFARDGAFFFRQEIYRSDAYITELNPTAWTVKSDPKRVSDRLVGSTGTPAWSPDGKQLAYVIDKTGAGRYTGGTVTYVVRNTASMREREFTAPVSNSFFSSFFRWFPDGNSLLLPKWTGPPAANGRRVFERLDLTTGEIRTFFDAGWSNDLNTIVSPDGHFVSYATSDGHDTSIKYLMRIDTRTMEESRVFLRRGVAGPAALHGLSGSPDGRQIAFFEPANDGNKMLGWNVWVTSLPDGNSREIGRPNGVWIIPTWCAWTPDGSGMLVIAGEGNKYFGKNQLWYIPVNGGEMHPVGVSMPILQSLSFGPDGRHLGFTGASNTVQVWQIGNLFRNVRAAGQ